MFSKDEIQKELDKSIERNQKILKEFREKVKFSEQKGQVIPSLYDQDKYIH